MFIGLAQRWFGYAVVFAIVGALVFVLLALDADPMMVWVALFALLLTVGRSRWLTKLIRCQSAAGVTATQVRKLLTAAALAVGASVAAVWLARELELVGLLALVGLITLLERQVLRRLRARYLDVEPSSLQGSPER